MSSFTPLEGGPDPATLLQPYAAVLGTNYVAEGQDGCAIREILSTTKAELSRLDEIIVWAKSRKETLTKLAEDYEALVGPIRRVPDDVLRELMAHCVANDWIGTKHSPAWTISQVCQRWRGVALSTPSLWSYISVNCDTWSDADWGKNGSTMVCRVNQMLARSKSSVLSIELDAYWGEMVDRGLWRLIFSQSERIVFLRVTIQYDIDSELSEDFPRPFPILQSLELYETRSFQNLFQKCLRLRDVRLLEIGESWECFKELQLPWAQLTSISIQHRWGDLDEILALLKNMGCFEELTLSVSDGVEMPSGLPQPIDGIITLPKLRLLVLRVYDSACATYLAQSLLLPALKELALDAGFGGMRDDNEKVYTRYKRFYHQFASLLASPKCSVTKLTVIDDDLRCHVSALLHLMPDLEYFRYLSIAPLEERSSKVAGHRLLSDFIKENDKPLPFPHLRELDVSGISLGGKADVIIKILQNRPSAFQTLRLHLLDNTLANDPSDFTEFARLVAQGIIIDIRSDKDETLKRKAENRRNNPPSGIHASFGDKGFLWTKMTGEYH